MNQLKHPCSSLYSDQGKMPPPLTLRDSWTPPLGHTHSREDQPFIKCQKEAGASPGRKIKVKAGAYGTATTLIKESTFPGNVLSFCPHPNSGAARWHSGGNRGKGSHPGKPADLSLPLSLHSKKGPLSSSCPTLTHRPL